jgi:hypothetical protein
MSAGRANRRLIRVPEGAFIEKDKKTGQKRVVSWTEIKKQIAEKADVFWQKRPEWQRPVKLTMRQRIDKDIKDTPRQNNLKKSLPDAP